MSAFDVLVVGAGIIGTAVAREAALAGLRVGVVEGHVTGGGITAAGMGHVVVMDDSPAQLALTRYSRTLWGNEVDLYPPSMEYESRGTIWVAADEEEMAEVHAKRLTYERASVASEVLDATTLLRLEPNLQRNLAGGLLVPNDGVIYPPAAANFYLRQAVTLRAEIFHARAVAAEKGQVRLSDGSRLTSGCIVLACGTDCSLLPELPVKKRKGHLAITDRYHGFVQHQLVELGYLKSAHKLESDSVAFNVQPRSTGQILIGSSRQFSDEDPAIDAAILHQMLRRASEYLPGLKGLSIIRTWTGFRASTKDKLPLLGPARGIKDDETLWLAAGFEGLGITNAPGAARLLIDGLLGRESAIDRTPYLPERLLMASEHVHA